MTEEQVLHHEKKQSKSTKQHRRRKVRTVLTKIWVNLLMLSIISLLLILAFFQTPYWKSQEVVSKPVPTSTNQVVTIKEESSIVDNAPGALRWAKDFAVAWVQGDMMAAQKYVATGWELPKDSIDGTRREVLGAQEWNVGTVDEGQVNVVVQVSVKDPIDSFKVNNLYLSVPMLIQSNGQFAVSDLPTYLPEPKKAVVKPKEMPANTLSITEQEAIKKKVEFFFQQYVGGTPQNIGFAFVDQKERAVLSGKLHQIPTIEITSIDGAASKAKVRAVAQVELLGSKNLMVLQLIMQKNGGQWLIESTTPSIPIQSTTP
ncbi:conjugal transfer protein [Risungbinella massiliensis]|uniref:conjugal transfer protein n=1 Tax=Risungbinella massiliensis TaxID=1329796 RepID=UPI0005CC6A9F|nr:conjugal transfer protein [Risungbinella massiliensis]